MGTRLSLLSSTVANNSSMSGAGIYRYVDSGSGVMLTIQDSTIAYNNTTSTTSTGGDGIYDTSPFYAIEIINSILAWNGGTGEGDDNCFSASPEPLVSLGHNLDSGNSCGFDQGSDQVNSDPLLGDLDFHDGFSLNYALLDTSPALETGGGCLATDQRGFDRPMDQDRDGLALCDIGAYEAEPYYLPPAIWFALILKP
jgi:hypothetical protein